MPKLVITRRQVLRGAGGFTIGLPFLPSLTAKAAFAAEPVFGRAKRFVAITTNHGGVLDATMYPAAGTPTVVDLYTNYKLRWSKLEGQVNGGRMQLSGVMNAPSTVLTERLLGKLNVLRGIDVPWGIMHNTGGHLGNFARNDGNGGDGQRMQAYPTPTIDQIMAYSNRFYASLTGIRERTMVTGNNGRMSYNFAVPSTRSGGITEVGRTSNPADLFKKVFDPASTSPTMTVAPRKPIVDRVLTNYRSLRQSNRRLSVDDRSRLDAHVDRLAELERKLVTGAPSQQIAACKDQKSPAGGAGAAYYKAINDVIVAAFMCGTSRIGVVGVRENELVSFGGSWHQDIAHKWDSGGQAKMAEAKQKVFEHVFVDLAAKLDAAEEQPGVSLLDNTLVAWTDENGEGTHSEHSRPVFTAGSAAGAFNTGRYIDYRNQEKGKLVRYGRVFGAAGLTHNQYLATVLWGMGVERSEYGTIQHMGATGYGAVYVDDVFKVAQVPEVMGRASDPLPLFAAS